RHCAGPVSDHGDQKGIRPVKGKPKKRKPKHPRSSGHPKPKSKRSPSPPLPPPAPVLPSLVELAASSPTRTPRDGFLVHIAGGPSWTGERKTSAGLKSAELEPRMPRYLCGTTPTAQDYQAILEDRGPAIVLADRCFGTIRDRLGSFGDVPGRMLEL